MDKQHSSSVNYRWIKIILSIIVISSLIAGCRLPWQAKPDSATPVVDTLESIQVPTPTLQPRVDLPPALVEVSPLPESVIALKEPITLYFNQAMDAVSVEAAVHFEPRISGRFEWENNQTVTFSPDQNLAAGSRLRLAIDTSAQAVNDKYLQEPIEVNFQVAEPLMVVQTLPGDGIQDVDPESIIFVAFNQPVVPLGDNLGAEPGFTLSPDVQGRGEWLNTSTYVFTPDPSMNGRTVYAIQLNENLVGTSGAGFSPNQQQQFNFTTTDPLVLKILPMPGELLSLDGPVELEFNMRMNPDSVEEQFSLVEPGGGDVPGTFEWDEAFRKLAFMPNRNLTRDSRYAIQLGAQAESAGGIPIIAPVETSRKTYPALKVDTGTLPEFSAYYGGYGQYLLSFTAPLDPETIDEFVSIDPDVAGVRNYVSEKDQRLYVNGYFQPDTTYTLTLDAGLKDIWGGRLGEGFSTTFPTPPATPSLNIISGYASYNIIFIPASESELIMQATNINSVSVEISPISVNDLITLLHPDNYRYREVFLPEVREVTTHELNLSSNQREVISLPLAYQGNSLAPGVYYLGIFTPDIDEDELQRNQKYYLIVSDNNLVMKVAPDQAFVWGSRLDDLSPLADAPLWVYNTEGQLLTKGKLDADGFFLGEYEREEGVYSSYFTVVGEPGEPDFAFSISTWQDGFVLYEQGIIMDTLPALYDAYIYTDRPIYRPGDTLYFKTVIFMRDNSLPVMPNLNAVNISVKGDPGLTGVPTTLYSEELTLSPFGTAAGFVSLPEESPTGFYWIDVSIGDEIIKALYFDVAAYRKPEINLTVGFDQSEVLIREDLAAEAQADYFFGLPAAGQTLSWTLYRKNVDFLLPGYQVGPEDDSWVRPFYPGYSPLGSFVDRGEGTTGEDGHVSLSFTADDLDQEDLRKGSLQQYSLEVTVIDQSGFPVSSRDSILVHPETYYIGVQPEMYFGSAGSVFDFSVLTVDWEKTPLGNVPLDATFEAITWKVEETGNPEMPYVYQAETSFIGGSSPRTNQEGQARVSFTPPDPGTYRLTLESGDAVTQVTVWVTGEGAALWPKRTLNQIDLTADASDYQPGQIAQIFVPNPFPGAVQALVTTERGRIMSSQVVEIAGAGYTLGIPITEESIPNIYVSVILVGEDENGKPNYRQGTLKLLVAPISKALNVDLSLEPSVTEPGEKVTLNIKITDQAGNPMRGEFSVALVDKALLALVPPNSLPILDAIYGQAPLSVQTSLSLQTYAKQLTLAPLDLGMGGGADEEGGMTIREDFPDTAFWREDIVTGADGTAQLSITLPDSLTTWVADVRGLTDEYLVGQGEVEVQTQKPLMIRPVTPRFLVDSDQVEMAAVVHNNTETTLPVDVTLQSVGFTLRDTNSTQRVVIEPGQSQRVTWWGVVESVETVDLVFQAVSGTLSDVSAPVWGDLQVKRYRMPYTMSTAGQLVEAGSRLELVSLPISTDPSSGELSLVLNPSLLVTLVDGIKAFETQPYSDTVSILSRLMANLNTYLVLNSLNIESLELLPKLDEEIRHGINQLLARQNFDGGWSWWGSSNLETASSDPFITAYVLLGLEEARQAGMEVSEAFIARARDYLIFQLPQPGDIESGWKLDRLVFEIYALRRHEINLNEMFEGLYARRSELSPWAVGLLALAMQERGGLGVRVSTLVADLEGRALRSATGVHWENDRFSWMLPGTPIFNTAVGVFALAQLDPASTSLPLALRYILAHRTAENLWSSTFESAWSLMAISKALQGTGDYQADYNFQVMLNDVFIAEGVAAGPESLNTVTVQTPIASLFPDSPNSLLIERGDGEGTLYYRVDLQTYQPAETALAIHRGINLQREYYLAGEGCPGKEGCEQIDAIDLDLDHAAQFITVALTLNLSQDMYNLMVEDFIPAGTEVMNRSFLTLQTIEESLPQFDPCDPFANGWGWWYFNQPQIYDDHVLWTADFVPAGTYILTYELLPYQRGIYQVLPAHAWQFFYPEVQGTSSGALFTIE